MGIFNFFRKIFEEEKVGEYEKEKITFSDIGNWIEKKEKENQTKEKEIFFLIKNKINLFINELKEKIDIVENVDIESKKVEDNIKAITNEGRKKYLESVDIFIENLDKLKKDNLEKFIEDTNKIFLSFNKNSRMSYERATILIGKEMENIKETVRIFSKNMIKLFNENKNIVDLSIVVSLVKIKLNKISEIEIELGVINETISSLHKKINDKKEENKKIIEEIERIKKSLDYLKNLGLQEKVKFLEEDLEKEILNLKQLIDFKALSNFFHIFEKEMKIVKIHKEDFSAEFKKDDGESILNLLNEAKLNNETISEKIREIKLKKEEIAKNKQKIKKNTTQELYSETTKMLLEIGDLNNEKAREEKRREVLRVSKEEIIGEIKENIGEMGGEMKE